MKLPAVGIVTLLFGLMGVALFPHCKQTRSLSGPHADSPRQQDSLQLVRTLDTLLFICWSVSQPGEGMFRGAATYLVYTGDQENRRWKAPNNYNYVEDREYVDHTCERIRGELPEGTPYRIDRYFTETESEGTWHVLALSLDRSGPKRKIYFAFLKLGGRFLLGDIDT